LTKPPQGLEQALLAPWWGQTLCKALEYLIEYPHPNIQTHPASLQIIEFYFASSTPFPLTSTAARLTFGLLPHYSLSLHYMKTSLAHLPESKQKEIAHILGIIKEETDVIERRYYRGIKNLYQLYMPICDEWTLVDNMDLIPEVIGKSDSFGKTVFNDELWSKIIQQGHEKS